MVEKKEPDPIKKPSLLSGVKRCFKRFYRMVSSHIGLIVLLILYSFAGAAIFEKIEGPHEEQQKEDIVDLRESILENAWNTTLAIKRNEGAFKQLLRLELKKYETQLYSAFAHGISSDSEETVWDFWGSMFYAATIYTTIGYGHIAPATDIGQIVTMIYASLGIPLCLIVLADLGKLFTRGIKFLWAYIRRFYYTGSCTRTEVGHSDGKTSPTTSTQSAPAYVVDDEFNLPIIVAILITMFYIFIGALLYTQWESWTYLEAFYFIFISISTIGFGDVLPEHPKYFLASSLYVLVGLALVSMVINTIMEAQETIISKASNKMAEVSKSIGISLEDVEDEKLNESTDSKK